MYHNLHLSKKITNLKVKEGKINMQTVFLIKVHLLHLSGLENSRNILMTEGQTVVSL